MAHVWVKKWSKVIFSKVGPGQSEVREEGFWGGVQGGWVGLSLK